MKLLPSTQTSRQIEAMEKLISGELTLREPCDCGSQVRHNNGGNYHYIMEFRLDSGKCWKRTTSTSDYDEWSEWEEIPFGKAIEEIADLSAKDW